MIRECEEAALRGRYGAFVICDEDQARLVIILVCHGCGVKGFSTVVYGLARALRAFFS